MKEKFVMIGEREKGKITKNEMYSIEKFIEKLKDSWRESPLPRPKVPKFFDRLSKKKMELAMLNYAENREINLLTNIEFTINLLIRHDKKGRK